MHQIDRDKGTCRVQAELLLRRDVDGRPSLNGMWHGARDKAVLEIAQLSSSIADDDPFLAEVRWPKID